MSTLEMMAAAKANPGKEFLRRSDSTLCVYRAAGSLSRWIGWHFSDSFGVELECDVNDADGWEEVQP